MIRPAGRRYRAREAVVLYVGYGAVERVATPVVMNTLEDAR
ncbi:DUF7512 family protein [Natrialbaceae archaeon A-gly3]